MKTNYESSSTRIIHSLKFSSILCITVLQGFTCGEENDHVLPAPFYDNFAHSLSDAYAALIYADSPFLAGGQREQVRIKEDSES